MSAWASGSPSPRADSCWNGRTPQRYAGNGTTLFLAMLIGCGLRRGELLSFAMDCIQVREEHWVIADLKGKAGHIRTVPVPRWVKAAVDVWSTLPESRKARCSVPSTSPADMRSLMPDCQRRTRANSILAWARLDPNGRTIPRMQAAAESRR